MLAILHIERATHIVCTRDAPNNPFAIDLYLSLTYALEKDLGVIQALIFYKFTSKNTTPIK